MIVGNKKPLFFTFCRWNTQKEVKAIKKKKLRKKNCKFVCAMTWTERDGLDRVVVVETIQPQLNFSSSFFRSPFKQSREPTFVDISLAHACDERAHATRAGARYAHTCRHATHAQDERTQSARTRKVRRTHAHATHTRRSRAHNSTRNQQAREREQKASLI